MTTSTSGAVGDLVRTNTVECLRIIKEEKDIAGHILQILQGPEKGYNSLKDILQNRSGPINKAVSTIQQYLERPEKWGDKQITFKISILGQIRAAQRELQSRRRNRDLDSDAGSAASNDTAFTQTSAGSATSAGGASATSARSRRRFTEISLEEKKALKKKKRAKLKARNETTKEQLAETIEQLAKAKAEIERLTQDPAANGELAQRELQRQLAEGKASFEQLQKQSEAARAENETLKEQATKQDRTITELHAVLEENATLIKLATDQDRALTELNARIKSMSNRESTSQAGSSQAGNDAEYVSRLHSHLHYLDHQLKGMQARSAQTEHFNAILQTQLGDLQQRFQGVSSHLAWYQNKFGVPANPESQPQ